MPGAAGAGGARGGGAHARDEPPGGTGEDSPVGEAGLRPHHAPAVVVGPAAQRGPLDVVAEQPVERPGELARRVGGDEDAAAIGQQLRGVEVRRRDDRPAGAHGVGQRARDDLVEVRVGRDEDVRGPEPAEQLVRLHEAVDEANVVGDAELAGALREGGAVPLALVADELRVRGAEDDVQDLRVVRDHRRQRFERELVALARAQEPEAQDHLAAGQPEARLDRVRRDERQVRDPVADDVDLRRVHAVLVRQQGGGGPRHHDRCGAGAAQVGEDAALARRGAAQDGMEGRDRGDRQRAHEVEDGLAVVGAPDAVLVLDRRDIDAGTEPARDLAVVGAVVHANPVVDLGGIVDPGSGTLEGDHLVVAGGAAQVTRERGDAAAAGRVGGDESDADDREAPIRAGTRWRTLGGTRRGWGRAKPAPSGQTGRTGLGRGPVGLCSIVKSTFSPPRRRSKSREASRAPRWKKYSFSSSAEMNPKPRSATMRLMVPVVTGDLLVLPEQGLQNARPVRREEGVTTRSRATRRGGPLPYTRPGGLPRETAGSVHDSGAAPGAPGVSRRGVPPSRTSCGAAPPWPRG